MQTTSALMNTAAARRLEIADDIEGFVWTFEWLPDIQASKRCRRCGPSTKVGLGSILIHGNQDVPDGGRHTIDEIGVAPIATV